MTSGVYAIFNRESGKTYIGSAVNLDSRRRQHFSQLSKGASHSLHLQAAWDKYGEDAFVFVVLERCPRDSLISHEQKWLSLMRPGYNKRSDADSNLGLKYRPESKEKMRQAKLANPVRYWLGKRRSPETVEAMRAASTGKRMSLENRAKLSERMKENKYRLGLEPYNKRKESP